MKRKLLALAAALICCVLCAGAVTAAAQSSPPSARDTYDGILDFERGEKSVQEWIDTDLAALAGTGAEWFVLCLAQSGEQYDFSAYEAALLDYLAQNKVPSATTRQKYALVLAAIGSTDSYILSVANDSIGSLGIMSYVYGLHLLHTGYPGNQTVDGAIDHILALQKADGGWAISGSTSDADVTAMTLQALAPHKQGRADVSAAIDKALSLLSARQTESGGFVSYGVENPESAAQVIIALCALDIDPLTDPRFIKNGNTAAHAIATFAQENGGYCHAAGGAYSAAATAQVLCAATAHMRYAAGKSPLYDLDYARPGEVESPAGSEQDTTAAPDRPPVADDGLGYKPYACIGVVLLGGIVCLVLLLVGKRHYKNFIAAALATCVLLAAVIVIDVRLPEDYYNGQSESKQNPIGRVTLTVRCDRVPGLDRIEYLPDDGVLLATEIYEIEAGETVYDILTEAARKHGLHVDASGLGESVYVRGIGQLYEQEHGELSGWVYYVNGTSPSMGCGSYELADGDEILFDYSLTLGND